MLKLLSRQMDVHVLSLVHDPEEASHAGDLTGLTASVRTVAVPRFTNLLKSVVRLPSTQPTTHSMLDAPQMGRTIDDVVRTSRPDVVLAYCSGMAKWAVKPPLDRIPLVLDMVDVDSAKWRDLTAVTRPPLSWVYNREARCLSRFEAEATRRAVATTVVTPKERNTLLDLAPDARIEVVPNGVDVASLAPTGPASASANVVFCGVMNYAPNERAATWLARDVWPLVRARRADATLTIVGSQPSSAVRALASTAQGIEVTGAVPDVRPYLWRAAVATAPIRTARGIQNKVLEAVAAGLPTVVTPNIEAALPDTVRKAVVGAADTNELAAAIVRLLAMSPDQRRAIASDAQIDDLGWDHQLAPFGDLLREAGALRR